ncbi:MAG: ATP-binding protein [Leptolyngbyaceae bacterium]|nr:ATP-binding protein [Leptolyngbyaceae bacterium]
MTIHKRLLCGYGLILGIALTGTTSGLVIGNHHQQSALEDQRMATSERKLLNDLQIQILYNRPAQQLSPHLANKVDFWVESQTLLGRLTSIQMVLAQHKTTHDDGGSALDADAPLPNPTAAPADLTITPPNYYSHLSEYEITVAQLHQRIQLFIQTVEALYDRSGQLTDVAAAQDSLLELERSPEFIAFIEFSDELARWQTQVDAQEKQAEVALLRAEKLRNQLVLGSLLASLAIAAVVAWWNSRAIARPLQSVTTVAQRITQDKNFDLEVPVHQQDEVGILADALNQLIKQVKLLLTQLRQKNTDLEAALNQLSRQQQQLIQAEKMSSLGQLVAGVAHEINNPVNFIHGNLSHVEDYTQDLLKAMQLYQQYYPAAHPQLDSDLEALEVSFIQEDLPKILQSMQLGTKRIRDIVLSLRKFSHMDEAEIKAVDIHEGLNNTLILLQHRIKANPSRPEVTITKCYGDVPWVECYPGLLNQVFMNILANAVDALEDKGAHHPHESEVVPLRQITIHTALIAGAEHELWVEVAIADNAMGIPPQIQQQIFDPFFTTKPMGKGTGMGMSISYQIVAEKHGGQLTCQSTVGEGPTFTIQLPLKQLGVTLPMPQNPLPDPPQEAIAEVAR